MWANLCPHSICPVFGNDLFLFASGIDNFLTSDIIKKPVIKRCCFQMEVWYRHSVSVCFFFIMKVALHTANVAGVGMPEISKQPCRQLGHHALLIVCASVSTEECHSYKQN